MAVTGAKRRAARKRTRVTGGGGGLGARPKSQRQGYLAFRDESPWKLPDLTKPAEVAPPAPNTAVVTPPSAPAAPVAPGAVEPGDPFHVKPTDGTLVAGAKTQAFGQYSGALAGIAHADSQLQRDTGYTALAPGQEAPAGVRTVKDPVTGRVFAVGIDGNPYSQQAELMLAFEQRRAGARNSAAGGGSLFDGSFGNQLRNVDHQESGAQYELGSNFLSSLLELGGRRQSAFDEAMALIGSAGQEQAALDALKPDPAPDAPAAPAAPAATPDQAAAKFAFDQDQTRARQTQKEAAAKAKAKARKKKRKR